MANSKWPSITDDLIESLEERYPNRLPTDDKDFEPVALARKRGQQDVIEFLKLTRSRQTKR